MIMDGSAEIADTGDLADAVDGPLIEELVGRARAQGLELTGPNGLLGALTKRILESALEGRSLITSATKSTNVLVRRVGTSVTGLAPRRS
jgi:hypothetical protein